LTENQMTVRRLWTADGVFDVTGAGYAPDGSVVDGTGRPAVRPADGALLWSLLAGIACSDAKVVDHQGRWVVVGDPTEAAMVVAGRKAGLDPEDVAARYPRVAVVPFSSQRQLMASLQEDRTRGGWLVLVKGAAERVVAGCGTQMTADGAARPLDAAAALRASAELAGEGLRVLATAVGRIDDAGAFERVLADGDLTFTGLQAMHDPPRPAAIAAIGACHTAGIDVKMITGDHATTATVIADRLGLLGGRGGRGDGEVLTGEQLAALSAEDYPAAVERAGVFARVSPEQKLRLVEALQSHDHVVAMTGDGVNDAPALRQADIGLAMGQGGTEVAKEAADMVLTDDDFATIEAAVEEGRGVFDNLTKFIVWTLPTNMGEGLVILVAILLGTALPILPVQILWINMTTAVALGLMLAFEPKEPGIMSRPPRDPRRPLLTGALLQRILLVSALLVGGAWWLFEWETANGATLGEARTVAVNLFVTVEAFYLFSCRSLTRSVWRIGAASNRWVIGGVIVQAAAQLALTYLPVMNHLFGTEPIGGQAWLRILAVALGATAVVAVDKRLRHRLV
jgi:cation-transporting ATPase F